MLFKLAKRFLTEVDKRVLWNFIYKFGWKGTCTVNAFSKSVKRGNNSFPAFLVMSITSHCNLRCQGCWVTPSDPPVQLSLEQMDKIVVECKKNGSFFFGILGGEPLLHPDLFVLIEKHPDAYFQVFTNGTLLTDDIAAEMRRLGNVTPLLSVEGDIVVSDQRRGGTDVYKQTVAGLDNCRNNRLVTGVATSVCRSNIDELVSEEFLQELISRNVHYVWYYIYRPVGTDPSPELILREDEILRLRKFMVEMRSKYPIIIVDAYWDADGNAVCPAAMGLSHHIAPNGDLEFCPPIQFAKENISDYDSLSDMFAASEFISNFKKFAADKTRGCILLEDPHLMKEFLEKEGAADSSGRGSAYSEIASMKSCAGHNIPGKEIPEKSWVYRFAKKKSFFGFGAYG
ncbi:MAG: radical SAM protein [Kiritimatiellae bacterium]|nr:radical SAM protein [Kiritimatiellia bacterium]